MIERPDNDDEDDRKDGEGEGEGDSKGTQGSSGKGSQGKGETDGSFGDGKAGSASGMGMRLSVNKSKQVYAEHRSLNAMEAVEAFTEFCSDVFRASAQLAVNFIEKAKMTVANANAFGILHWTVEFQKNLSGFDKTRERNRGADSQGLKKDKPRAGKKFSPNTGPSGAQ